MRWADLDTLNHVNNVVYLEYAAESRVILVEDGVVGAGEQVERIAVDFLRPLLLTTRPVDVVSTRKGDELVQELCHQDGDSRTVFARVTTTFGARSPLTSRPPSLPPYLLRLRRGDIDASGQVGETKIFEFFQEARIFLFTSLAGDHWAAGRFVVGRVVVTYGEPMGWRREPYPVQSWLSRIGESSITVEAEIVDGGTVHAHATAVLVGFDLATQRSRRMSDEERSAFAGFIPPG